MSGERRRRRGDANMSKGMGMKAGMKVKGEGSKGDGRKR